MNEQLEDILEHEQDFAADQLKLSYEFITINQELVFVWTSSFNSSQEYRVESLEYDIKVVVLNDEEEINDEEETECKYAVVDKFLVRRKEASDYLEVFELSFDQGKLVDGPSTGQFNIKRKIKIEEFLQGPILKMQAVSRTSQYSITNRSYGEPHKFGSRLQLTTEEFNMILDLDRISEEGESAP